MIRRSTIVATILAAAIVAASAAAKEPPNGGKPFPCWQVKAAAAWYSQRQLEQKGREQGVTPSQVAAARACFKASK